MGNKSLLQASLFLKSAGSVCSSHQKSGATQSRLSVQASYPVVYCRFIALLFSSPLDIQRKPNRIEKVYPFFIFFLKFLTNPLQIQATKVVARQGCLQVKKTVTALKQDSNEVRVAASSGEERIYLQPQQTRSYPISYFLQSCYLYWVNQPREQPSSHSAYFQYQKNNVQTIQVQSSQIVIFSPIDNSFTAKLTIEQRKLRTLNSSRILVKIGRINSTRIVKTK